MMENAVQKVYLRTDLNILIITYLSCGQLIVYGKLLSYSGQKLSILDSSLTRLSLKRGNKNLQNMCLTQIHNVFTGLLVYS